MNVGSYHIESLIAETPLGALYAGVARGGEQRVMVYRVRPDLSRADGGDARLPAKLQAQSRLLREARVPGLPKLLDVGRLPDQTVYLVWSAVSSESLVSAVARHRETSSSVDAFLVEMGQRLARTLARAHAEGVYHLSLTPAQVMVADDPASDERIALLGLGLATLLDRSRAGDFPEEHRLYAAPEQRDTRAQALPSPGAADVYALGVLLGQLLGERSDLKALLSQMCAADPGARPSMADVSAQLQVTQPSAAPPKMAAPEKPVPPRAPHAGRKSSEAVQRPALAVEDAGFTQADSLPNMRPIGPAAGGAGSAAAPSALARDSAGERSGGEVDRIGSLFGNFRVVRKIGEGGMGVVYEAEHTKIGRRAAVKLLHGRYAESDGFARRFLNEARAVNIVRHPGLVEIFEFGKLPDGTLFYIMEYLEGEAMDRRIEKRQGPFAEEEAINIALQVARALAAAHEKGIVHRDLKPGNIMFVPDPVNPGLDWVKLLDFGIAKVRAPQTGAVTDPEKTGEDTGQGVRLGTPLYMAPEQHGGAVDVDGRADVFSLGVVLYELLAGKTPFRNNSLSLLISKPPPIEKLNPTVRPQISELVRRMMAMEAEGRPTMREVEAQLTALLASPQRPHRRLLSLGAVGVVTLLLGVLSVLLWLRRPPSPAELRAQAMAVLQTALSSGDASLQSLAAAAIGGSHDLDARSLLRPILAATQTTAGVREAAVRALSELGDNEVQAQLLQIVQQDPTSQGSLTISAASALAQLQHPRGMEVLRQVLASGDELRRVQAALALLEHGDFSGSELLWARIGRSGGATRTLTSVLGRLALSGDERARNRLAEEFATLPSGEARIYVAYALSRLGDEAARSDLRRLAGEPGASGAAATDAPRGEREDKASEISDRLLAARLLSALGDAEVGTRQPLRTWLLSVAADPRQADARRELALASLGDSGDATLLAPLGEVLTARGSSPRLLIAAAGAILTLLSGEPARLAEQSLGWARSALRGESVSERELAVLALGDLDDPATIGELGQALRDREVRVRRQAAIQLARKDLLPALRELRGALVDSDVQVRLAGVDSMSKLLQALRKSSPATAPQTEAGAALRTWLEQAGDASSELDRVLRAGLLFQLGDQGRKASLVAGLASKDPLVRKLSISLLVGAGEERAIEKALADPDRAVRLAAALHLAERGHPQGLQILRGFVAGGDVDGLLAYTALRRLKQESQPPPGLSTLLSTAELSTRYAVVDILRELPPGQALLLLQLASIDRASVVRRLVLAVAAGFYRGTQRPGFLELILVLRADSDVIVRAYAAQLIAELGRVPARPPVSAEKPVAAPVAGQNDSAAAVGHSPSDANRRTDGGVPATGAPVNGQLYLEGEELVRVQIDRGPPTLLSDKPVVLPAGRHVLRYLGGQQEFTLAGAQTLRLRVPVRLSDQLLADGREALSRSDLSKAQEHLERLRRLLQRGVRGPAPPALQADVAFELARLYEARGQLRESLSEYNRCLAIPAAQRRPELNAALPAMLTRMAGRAGRIQIFTMAGGRCTMTQELLLPPGEQIISIGRGQTRSVFSQIGSTNKLMACE